MRFARTARSFVTRALSRRTMPVEVTTDQAPVYPAVIEQFAPQAQHVSEPYANNIVEHITVGPNPRSVRCAG
jgi:transposase-like protein